MCYLRICSSEGVSTHACGDCQSRSCQRISRVRTQSRNRLEAVETVRAIPASMNATKKINVNFSSLVGLKAELLRKQTEVKEARVKAETVRVIPKLKRKKKTPREGSGETRENLTDADDINAHKKSKLMLEAKARLYERLKRSRNSNEKFLVDFTNKSDESEEEPVDEECYEGRDIEPEDNWVEYVDCFGRTRKCLREDLPAMKEKDELIKHQVMKDNDESRKSEDADKDSLVKEKEPEIEVMRRKWEEQTQKLSEKVNIHYQDVLFDEARAHGVGYYAFSQDEEQRAKQQENLATLRKQTEQKQKEMKELRELKEKMEENRLKAARIRQRIRAGLPAEPTEEELALENNKISSSSVSSNSEANGKTDTSDSNIKEETPVTEQDKDTENKEEKDKSENSAVVIENKIKALGELLGKRTTWQEMSQEEWIEKCRNERKSEFAPHYDNFQSAGYLHNTQNDKTELIIDKESLETKSNNIETEVSSEDTAFKTQSDIQVDFQLDTQNETSDKDTTNLQDDTSNIIGPMPPSEIQTNSQSDNTSDVIGPMPPSEVQSNSQSDNTSDVIGSMPPLEVQSNSQSADTSDVIGPIPSSEVQSNSQSDDTSDVIGSMPPPEISSSYPPANSVVYNTVYNIDNSHQYPDMTGNPLASSINTYQMPAFQNMNVAYPIPYNVASNSSNPSGYFYPYIPMTTPLTDSNYYTSVNTMYSYPDNVHTTKSENISKSNTTDTSNKDLNEENIAAGLRYLRQKFEESQNH